MFLAAPSPVPAQEVAPKPLSIQGLTPFGVRQSVTEGWGTLQFTVVNPTPTAREARVVVYYADREDVQYARDVWVPGRSSLTTWVTVGPAPAQRSDLAREIRSILYERTGGANSIVLPPESERVRARPVPYKRRELTTAVLADATVALPGEPERPTAPPDVLALARLVRSQSGLSDSVSVVSEGPLRPFPEAFDGVDVLVLAGNRLADDPPGRAAVRRWVAGGGRLWVMLDRVDPATVAPLLGEDFDVAVVDRVGLTRLSLRGTSDDTAETREVEAPVPFVRVIPSPADRVLATADGWPAALSRRIGRGRVLFTTLAGPGWTVTRPAPAPKGPKKDGPAPVASEVLGLVPAASVLATELHTAPQTDPVPPESFRPMLTEDIGYSIVGRGPATAILCGFVVVLAGLGVGLRSAGRPELIGALAPVAALVATGLFVGLGVRSRVAVPPTVGVAGVVDPVAGGDEAVVTGLYAVFHPESGPAEIGTGRGAELGLDAEGLDGQTRSRVQTDVDSWRWAGLSFPAGVRTGPFRETIKAGRIAAVARFGPSGLEGRLTTGAFRTPTDAVLVTQGHDALAARLGADGAFRAASADVLPAGQYAAGAVLTDRQQRQQAISGRLFGGPLPRHLAGRELLVAWTDPTTVPLAGNEGTRVVGSVLLAVPLEYERTPADTAVVVPRGFAPPRRVQGKESIPVTTSAQIPVDMRLRFQLPVSVLPLKIERASLFARVRAPGRKFSVAGVSDGKPTPLFQAESPIDPIHVDITDAALLRLDEQGGLLVDVAVSAVVGAGDSEWKIESLGLEIAGRTVPK